MKFANFLLSPSIKQKQILSKKINTTLEYIENSQYENSSFGYCLRCHYEQYGVEPDSDNIKCENCDDGIITGIHYLVMSDSLRFWPKDKIDKIKEIMKKYNIPFYD